MLLFLVAALAEEACEARSTDQDVRALVHATEEAFLALDADMFRTDRDELYASVLCAGEVLAAPSIAGFFRVRALDAHLRRDTREVLSNTWTMGEIDPLPPRSSVMPKGHPVRNAWLQGRERGPSATELLPVPDGGRILIDGRDVLEMPTERPRLIQFVSEGDVLWTRVYDGLDKPTYDALKDSEEVRARYERAVLISAPRKPVELPVIAGVLGAGAIATYAASYASFRSFKKSSELEQIQQRRATTNALFFTSTGMAVGAIGLGTYAAVTW